MNVVSTLAYAMGYRWSREDEMWVHPNGGTFKNQRDIARHICNLANQIAEGTEEESESEDNFLNEFCGFLQFSNLVNPNEEPHPMGFWVELNLNLLRRMPQQSAIKNFVVFLEASLSFFEKLTQLNDEEATQLIYDNGAELIHLLVAMLLIEGNNQP
jgi:hypothetical protein